MSHWIFWIIWMLPVLPAGDKCRPVLAKWGTPDTTPVVPMHTWVTIPQKPLLLVLAKHSHLRSHKILKDPRQKHPNAVRFHELQDGGTYFGNNTHFGNPIPSPYLTVHRPPLLTLTGVHVWMECWFLQWMPFPECSELYSSSHSPPLSVPSSLSVQRCKKRIGATWEEEEEVQEEEMCHQSTTWNYNLHWPHKWVNLQDYQLINHIQGSFLTDQS